LTSSCAFIVTAWDEMSRITFLAPYISRCHHRRQCSTGTFY